MLHANLDAPMSVHRRGMGLVGSGIHPQGLLHRWYSVAKKKEVLIKYMGSQQLNTYQLVLFRANH
jgi:hypothetical protein